MTDASTLSALLAGLANGHANMPLLVVEVVVTPPRTLRGPPAPSLPALDLTRAAVLNRTEYAKQLKASVCPGQGHHREGRLTPKAMRLLADKPDRLLAFDQLRELVHLTMGNELLLLTPVSVLCLLHGRKCTDGGRLLLNVPNNPRTLERVNPAAAKVTAA